MFRQLRRVGALPALLIALLSAPAYADQIEQHDSLVQKYVTEQHANPLVADCAAHASFVVSTSSYYDRAEFPENTLDNEHAQTQPWNEAFDNGKQRIKVDTMVTITGQGYRKDPHAAPDPLTFKCGYVDNKMLAFSYNDPVPSAVSHSGKKGHGKTGKNTHRSKKTHAASGSASKRGTTAHVHSGKSGSAKKPASEGKQPAAKSTN
jgi:hypothetical protein